MSNLDDRMWATMPSRRSFLQRMGLGVGALGAGLFGGLALPESVLAVCEPPGNPGTPKPWRKDCRMILPRRPASTLSAAEITQLKDAYKAMRALDTSAPNDPRGFLRQANVHCWYCGAGTQVHFTWQFFAWHRAYLYFHERILGKLIGDMNFRLPYWDWDTPSHRKLPGAYSDPNDNSNPLWNGTRSMDPTEEIPEEDVGEDVMEAALTADTFTEFGGTASGSGIPEGTPHGAVHVDVGGDMGFFDSAGKDPVFYAHHANVDKMWSDWNKASSIHTNPTATACPRISRSTSRSTPPTGLTPRVSSPRCSTGTRCMTSTRSEPSGGCPSSPPRARPSPAPTTAGGSTRTAAAPASTPLPPSG